MHILNIVLISSTIYTEYIPVFCNQNNQHCSMRTRVMSFMRDLYKTSFKLLNYRTFKALWSFWEIIVTIVTILLSLHKKKNGDNLSMLIDTWERYVGKRVENRWKRVRLKKKPNRNEKSRKNGAEGEVQGDDDNRTDDRRTGSDPGARIIMVVALG